MRTILVCTETIYNRQDMTERLYAVYQKRWGIDIYLLCCLLYNQRIVLLPILTRLMKVVDFF